MLNDIYKNFDSILDHHDVYKVFKGKMQDWVQWEGPIICKTANTPINIRKTRPELIKKNLKVFLSVFNSHNQDLIILKRHLQPKNKPPALVVTPPLQLSEQKAVNRGLNSLDIFFFQHCFEFIEFYRLVTIQSYIGKTAVSTLIKLTKAAVDHRPQAYWLKTSFHVSAVRWRRLVTPTWLHQVCPNAMGTGTPWTSPTWHWTCWLSLERLSCCTCLASHCGSG